MMQPKLLSLATAVPKHRIGQDQAARLAGDILGRRAKVFKRFLPVYSNSGIRQRYSAVPLEWFKKEHGFGERNRIYIREALELLERVALDALKKAGRGLESVTDIVVVSTTGIATPSLDALLMERLKMNPRTRRTPIFGLGCAGGVLGLGRAACLAREGPNRTVLLLVVELCTLSFQKNDISKRNIIATALFGDGAAAAVISCTGKGLQLGPQEEFTLPASLDIMGWDVTDTGFSVIFSRDIPHLVRTKMKPLAEDFLRRNGLRLVDVDYFVSHPGGAKVISALEEIFGCVEGAMIDSREILAEFGNMSAPTVLFALARVLEKRERGKRFFLTSLGPGFTLGMMLAES